MWAAVVVVAAMVAGSPAHSKRIECPSQCRCYLDAEQYRTAHCSPSAFSQPHSKQIFPGIDNLDLKPVHRTHPVKLSHAMFQRFKNLQILNLSNSSIGWVPEGTFVGLRSVFDVDLSHNKIRRLSSGVLKGLPKLHTLLLRGNPLDPPSCAIISDSLRQLDLAQCEIESLPPLFFVGVPGLTHLMLEGNRLKTFSGLPLGLRFINLVDNNIVDVQAHPLTSMKSLRNIDLSGNPFNCTCRLLVMQDWLSKNGIMMGNDVVCAAPPAYYGRNLRKIDEDELCKYEGRRQSSVNEIQRSPPNRQERPKVVSLSLTAHQGDEGFMGDQPAGDAEVLNSNKETQSYGTHMESVMDYSDEGSGDEPFIDPEEWSSESFESTTERGAKSMDTKDFTFATSESFSNEITSVEVTSPMTPSTVKVEESEEEVEGSGDYFSTTPIGIVPVMESDSAEIEEESSTVPPTSETTSTEASVPIMPIHIESEPEVTSSEAPVAPTPETSSEEPVMPLPEVVSEAPQPPSSTEPVVTPKLEAPSTTEQFVERVEIGEELAEPSKGPSESFEDVSTEASRSNATVVGEASTNIYQTAGTYILIAAIAIPIIILVLMALFRRRSPRKGVLRLPADAEANPGTELQDMDTLLPKNGENGVKLVAANKVNGAAHPSDSKSAEELAPLGAEPDVSSPDEEDRRAPSPPASPRQNGSQPVQRAKAKLTVLPDSVPKTPVFIHKPFSD